MGWIRLSGFVVLFAPRHVQTSLLNPENSGFSVSVCARARCPPRPPFHSLVEALGQGRSCHQLLSLNDCLRTSLLSACQPDVDRGNDRFRLAHPATVLHMQLEDSCISHALSPSSQCPHFLAHAGGEHGQSENSAGPPPPARFVLWGAVMDTILRPNRSLIRLQKRL